MSVVGYIFELLLMQSMFLVSDDDRKLLVLRWFNVDSSVLLFTCIIRELQSRADMSEVSRPSTLKLEPSMTPTRAVSLNASASLSAPYVRTRKIFDKASDVVSVRISFVSFISLLSLSYLELANSLITCISSISFWFSFDKKFHSICFVQFSQQMTCNITSICTHRLFAMTTWC